MDSNTEWGQIGYDDFIAFMLKDYFDPSPNAVHMHEYMDQLRKHNIYFNTTARFNYRLGWLKAWSEL